MRTLYDLRADPEFAEEYARRRRQMTEDACTALQGRMSEAVETIAELMSGQETPAKIRLDAAKAILDIGLKCFETLDILPRLEALEAAENRHNPPKGVNR